MPSYPSWVSNRPLEADEVVLLRAMVEADEVASSQGLHDETFGVALLNGGVTFLGHKALAGERPLVSRRAVLGLREAGLFMVVSERRHLLRLYLAPDARQRLAQQSLPIGNLPRIETISARIAGAARADCRVGPAVTANRRPGRPKGTRSVPRQQIIDRFRSLHANYGRHPTQRELADNLDPRIEPRTLQQHLADYGLPWPIE